MYIYFYISGVKLADFHKVFCFVWFFVVDFVLLINLYPASLNWLSQSVFHSHSHFCYFLLFNLASVVSLLSIKALTICFIIPLAPSFLSCTMPSSFPFHPYILFFSQLYFMPILFCKTSWFLLIRDTLITLFKSSFTFIFATSFIPSFFYFFVFSLLG